MTRRYTLHTEWIQLGYRTDTEWIQLGYRSDTEKHIKIPN
jgi:hypothetical protein